MIPQKRLEIEMAGTDTTGTLDCGPSRLDAFGWAWQNARSQGLRLHAREAAQDATVIGSFRFLSSRWVTRVVATGFVLGAFGFFAGFLMFVSAIERNERAPGKHADAIVVLTGGAQRIDDAVALLAAGYGRRLLISGVNERTSREEIAKLNPDQSHWIECCVDLDYRARNTIGNAIEARRWIRRNHFETVTVVTSNYHMPRTLVEIRHALGDANELVPHPVVTEGLDVTRWWADPATARLLGAEYVKFLAAWVRTRFEHDPERSRFAVLIGRSKPAKDPIQLVAEPALLTPN